MRSHLSPSGALLILLCLDLNFQPLPDYVLGSCVVAVLLSFPDPQPQTRFHTPLDRLRNPYARIQYRGPMRSECGQRNDAQPAAGIALMQSLIFSQHTSTILMRPVKHLVKCLMVYGAPRQANAKLHTLQCMKSNARLSCHCCTYCCLFKSSRV